MAAHTNEVTICTVSTPFHKRLLYYNHQFFNALNPDNATSWVIVNNPEIHVSRQRIRQLLDAHGLAHNHKTYRRMLYKEQRRYHDSTKIHQYISGHRILGGISLAEVSSKLPQSSPVEGESQEQFEYRKDKVLQSYHHAFNLELALSKVKTRYAVILDPDLYVVQKNWLLQLLTYMKLQQLALIGVPWNPRYFQKYRYFPATHFMMIDLKKIPKAEATFAPDLLDIQSNFEPTFWARYCYLERFPKFIRMLYLAANSKLAWQQDLHQRSLIGTSRDSGFRLYDHCKSRPDLRVETVSPVYRNSDGFIPATVSRLQRQLDDVTVKGEQDCFSYLPKRNNFLSQAGFAEHGFPDFRAFGWEEFMWRTAPFAFHIRGEVHRSRVGDVTDEGLLQGLNDILAKHSDISNRVRQFNGSPSNSPPSNPSVKNKNA